MDQKHRRQRQSQQGNVPELNLEKGLARASSASSGTSFSRSRLALSRMARGGGIGVWAGRIGGVIWRSKANLMGRKNGWALTSDAPATDPKRLSSCLSSKRRTSDLHWLETACGFEGNTTSVCRMRVNVSFRADPLNGVVPYY